MRINTNTQAMNANRVLDMNTTRLDGFTTRIRRFDERIAAMEERLADKEDRLRRQFAASELAIAGLQAQQTSLLQGLSGLGLTQA